VRCGASCSAPPSLAPTLLQLDFSRLAEQTFLIVVFSFLLVDIFDNAGTLIGVAHRAGLLDKDGNLPRMRQALEETRRGFRDDVGELGLRQLARVHDEFASRALSFGGIGDEGPGAGARYDQPFRGQPLEHSIHDRAAGATRR